MEKGINVKNFFDNNKELHNTKLNGIVILNPSEINQNDSIIIASTWSEEILKQLKENNSSLDKIYVVDPWNQIFDTEILDVDIEE